MIDLTSLFQVVISLTAAIVTVYLVPWIRSRFSESQIAVLEAAVHTAVYAAEKLYGAGAGEKKLAFAKTWLAGRGITVDEDELRGYINAAILEMDLYKEPDIPAMPEETAAE